MKKTIAELRRCELAFFNRDYIHDQTIAKNLVNRYYRLAVLADRLSVMDNDERSYKRADSMRIKYNSMEKRLIADLKKYGITIDYYSHMPTLVKIGTTKTALTRFMY